MFYADLPPLLDSLTCVPRVRRGFVKRNANDWLLITSLVIITPLTCSAPLDVGVPKISSSISPSLALYDNR